MTRRLAPLALAAALAGGPLAGRDPGQDRDGGVPFAGTELFRGLLHYHKVEPVTPDELPLLGGHQVVIVFHGRVSPRAARNVPWVLRNGGAVLIATDDPVALGPVLGDGSAVDVTGDQVVCPDPAQTLGRNARRPFAVPSAGTAFGAVGRQLGLPLPPPAAHWDLMTGLTRVATAGPSRVRVGASKSRYADAQLAVLAAGSRAEGAGRDLTADERALALVGEVRTGPGRAARCLVVADAGVFTNGMIAAAQPDGTPTHNLLFADNVVRWLRGEDGPAGRTRCLFVEDGEVRDKFDDVKLDALTLPPLPVPDIDPLDPRVQKLLTDKANEAVAGLQDRDLVNRALVGPTGARFGETMRAAAVAGAAAALVFLLRRAWAARHAPDLPPVPTDTGRVAGSGPPGSLARRREEALQAGQYTDLVRDYLRDLFAAQGLVPAAGDPPRRLPPVAVTGPAAGAVKADLRALWEVAFGPRPRPITYTRWKELEPMVDAARRAADDGRWRPATGGETA